MPSHFKKLSPPKKSQVYDAYWNFAGERNNVFIRRLTNSQGPWTDDAIIKSYRFTNTFRASDRVSQYLINLQYTAPQSPKETFFKTLLFKIFNKIETYNYLERALGAINFASFSAERFDSLLTYRMASGHTIYSPAYIMPSAGNVFGFKLKHSNHLALLSRLMKDKIYLRIANAESLEAVYEILLGCPSFGSFLAFQYTIDLNYSDLIKFSEMDFVVAGPGAKNGILKCFDSLGDFSYEDVIRFMAENQEKECERLGLQSPSLWGRRLQLIDCQNIFCEVDKYLRVTHPQLSVKSGKTRIKQKFHAPKEPIPFFFPPKWGINSKIEIECQQRENVNIFS